MANNNAKNSKVYQLMNRIQDYLDKYYLDGIVGLIPYGVGDVVTAFFAVVFVWFSACKVRSLPLTLAVLNNSLRDVFLGLIPFYIGDAIDFFHKANKQNMGLVRGFIDGDQETISTVNRKAWQSAVFIVIFLMLIVLMVWLLVTATTWLFGQLLRS